MHVLDWVVHAVCWLKSGCSVWGEYPRKHKRQKKLQIETWQSLQLDVKQKILKIMPVMVLLRMPGRWQVCGGRYKNKILCFLIKSGSYWHVVL